MDVWRVREIAEPQRWNVKTLSEAAGLAYGTVYSIWTNKATRVDFETLYKLAFVLKVHPTQLFKPAKLFLIDPAVEQDGYTYNAVHRTGLGDAWLTYVRPGSSFPEQPGDKHLVPAPEDWESRIVKELE